MKHIFLRGGILAAVVYIAWQLGFVVENRPQFGLSDAFAAERLAASVRPPLTTSRVTGRPEPPPAYLTPRVFPNLHFVHPLEMVVAPGSDRWFVVEQAARIFSFPNRQDCTHAEPFLDIPKQIRTLPDTAVVGDAYGLVFHPKFAENHYCYVCYVVVGKPGNVSLADGTRVSRFTVTGDDPPRCDPASEKILITWRGGGHNGGSLKFGPDGYLYISAGDSGDPNPPDPRNTGQDISDLLSSILRIDVDHPSGDKPYSIPADNPFVKTPGARGEVWAYGLRNPWRMSFDRETGDLWVGDVGWELWEMVDRIVKGGNYGWSIMEGPQPVHPDGKRGPTPIIPPNLQFPHTEACSIIGGYVYRGKRLPELVGNYICGDWETRRVWGTKFDGDKVVSHRELANDGPRIVAFGEGHDGELYILDYDLGTIHELAPNPDRGTATKFPMTLGDTGLFSSIAKHELAPGVVPFSITAEQWADFATAERFVALPGQSSVNVYGEPIETPGTMFKQQFVFPKDGLLLKTFSMEMERGNPASKKRLETQLLHFDGRGWHGYSYRWNDDQTEAKLVGPAGEDRLLNVVDSHAAGGRRAQSWHYPGRNECLICHNPWTDYRLAFTLPQLAVKDQLGRLKDMAVLKPVGDVKEFGERQPPSPQALVNPADATADVSQRARSYLQANCAHCHQFGAGGTADIDLRKEMSIPEMKVVGVTPKQGAFGIADAQIVAPGDPYRSVLFFRTAKTGHGRMPHMGSEIVDEAGVNLLHDWIHALPIHNDVFVAIERLRALDEATAQGAERENYARDLAEKAKDIAQLDHRDEANDADRRQAAEQLARRAQEGPAVRVRERAETIAQLLSTTSAALQLSRTMENKPLPPAVHEQIVAAAAASGDAQIRDLFERYLPPEKRVKRLGNIIDRTALLSLPGDAGRGNALFFGNTAAQCKNCHRIGDRGGKLAPELTHIAKKFNCAQVLDKVLDPSKTIDPKYFAYLVETKDGKSFTGIIAEQNERELVLRDAQDKEIHIPAGEIEAQMKQTRSLMPEQLLRDLTAQEAADLLAFLQTLK